HTRSYGDWSSDVCSSDLLLPEFLRRPSASSLAPPANGGDAPSETDALGRYRKAGCRSSAGAEPSRDMRTEPLEEDTAPVDCSLQIGRASCRERLKSCECA